MIIIVLVTCYHGTYVYSTEISDNLTHNMWYHDSDILSPHVKSKIVLLIFAQFHMLFVCQIIAILQQFKMINPISPLGHVNLNTRKENLYLCMSMILYHLFKSFFQAGMQAVRENRYIILAKDFEKGYKNNVKKDEQEHEFYK